MTHLQEKMDAKWVQLIKLARTHGFLIHVHEGAALIATHKVQIATRNEDQYFAGQIINGICPIELGYKHCNIRNCDLCDLC